MHTTDRKLTLLGLNPTGDLAGLTCYTSRRRKIVWFDKSPPDKPPSHRQVLQRLRFTAAAQAWRSLTQEQRNAWNTACRRAHLRIAGYHLWIFWQLRRNLPIIRTIEHQSGCSLVPDRPL